MSPMPQRAEIVTGDRDGDAVRVGSARHLAERFRRQSPPPAAVDEQRERRVLVLGRKVVDDLPRRGAVGNIELSARRAAVIRRLALPAREDFRMLRDAGAVVVFLLQIDRHGSLLRRRRMRQQGRPDKSDKGAKTG
jgi:hypothetical protein